jgi:thioredoxin-like negative regulator of GroEL
MGVEATTDNFDDLVIKSDVLTLVDFWGPKCVRCLELMPFVEKLVSENEGRVKLVKVEAPKNRRLCLNLRLLSLPAFLFYRDGKELERLVGDGVTEEQLRDSLFRLMSK